MVRHALSRRVPAAIALAEALDLAPARPAVKMLLAHRFDATGAGFGAAACLDCSMRYRRRRLKAHFEVDGEAAGRLAAIAELVATLEVRPTHAEALAECGAPLHSGHCARSLLMPARLWPAGTEHASPSLYHRATAYRTRHPPGAASLIAARPSPRSLLNVILRRGGSEEAGVV